MTTWQSYERVKLLGEGTYGVVYLVRHLETGSHFAVKKLRLDDEEEGVPTTALREISVLREISEIADSMLPGQGAENIVKLIDVIYERQKLSLVFEYVHTDLKRFQDLAAEHVRAYRAKEAAEDGAEDDSAEMLALDVPESKADRALNAEMVYTLSRQLVLGLSFLHSRRVIHRDLKPHNLLVSANGDLKIADFGLARALSLPLRTYTHEVVTLWYRAPEILLGTRYYGNAVDIWSTACIISEMATGSPLFCGDSEIDQLFRIMRIRGTPTEEEWPDLKQLPDYQPIFPQWPRTALKEGSPQLESAVVDLLERMLVYEPTERITAKAALLHPYLASEPFVEPTTPTTADSSLDSSMGSFLETPSSASTAPSSPGLYGPPSSPCSGLQASPM